MIWDNEEVHISQYLDFQNSMEFTVEARSTTNNDLIDVWVLTISMDSRDGNVVLDHRLGQFGNAKISMLLKWACPNNYGINCIQNCPIVNANGYCDSNGVIHCISPFVGPPNCLRHGNPCDDRPCINGGTCEKNPENSLDYICTCPLGFAGKNCERQSCTADSCGEGTCTDGVCVCEQGFHGDNCEAIRCESTICQNRGICTVVENKHVCQCPNENVLGDNCEFICKPACLYGTCKLNKKKDDVFCDCFKGFGGHICDVDLGSGASGNKGGSSMAVKIVVPIVVLLAVALGVGLSVYFLVYQKKLNIPNLRPTRSSTDEL